MDRLERQNWLQSLKEGDQVANKYPSRYVIYTIKKITASGRIRLSNDMLLDYTGYKALDKFCRSIINIEPVTDEILKQTNKQKIV